MKLLFLAAAFAALASFADGANPAPAEKVLFEETFAGKIDKGWTWLREDPSAWRLENGALIFRTSTGYLHERSNPSKNVLLRPFPESGANAVEVHVESEPKIQFEHAALVYFVDDRHFVSVGRESLGGKVDLLMVTNIGARPVFDTVHYDRKDVWLRLSIGEKLISSEYRATESDPWLPIGGPRPVPSGSVQVGLITGGAGKDDQHEVSFRSFRILAVPAKL